MDEWSRYPQDIPESYRQAIGEICQRWSWLEFQLGVIAREILKINKPGGFAVMGGMDMGAISNVLMALASADFIWNGNDTLRDQVMHLGKKLHGIYRLRNQYIHGVWGYESSDNPDLGIWRFTDPEDRVSGENWYRKNLTEIQNDAQTLADYQTLAQQVTDDIKRAFR